MEKHHDEFASLASKPNDELAGRVDNRSHLVLELEFSHYAIVHAPPSHALYITPTLVPRE